MTLFGSSESEQNEQVLDWGQLLLSFFPSGDCCKSHSKVSFLKDKPTDWTDLQMFYVYTSFWEDRVTLSLRNTIVFLGDEDNLRIIRFGIGTQTKTLVWRDKMGPGRQKSWIQRDRKGRILITCNPDSSLIKNLLGPVNNGYLPIKPRREAEQDTASTPLGSALILFSFSSTDNIKK